MEQTKKYFLKQEGALYGSVIFVASMMGIISHYLLSALHFVSTLRENNNFFLFFLPFIGVLTAYVYQNYGKGAQKGNNLIIESTQKEGLVPLRMAVFTFIFTILTHLFGGSAGREGSAVQIGGVLSNKTGTFFKLEKEKRKQLIHAGISAGFSSIFGTPLAGAFFGMEMVFIGKLERNSLIPCFLASYLANFISIQMGTTHELHQIKDIPQFSVSILLIVVLASVLFGVFGYLFAWWVHTLKRIYQEKMNNYLLRAFIASVIFVAFIFIFNGQKYEGLSLGIIDEAFAGGSSFFDPILKLFFTGLTLGAGFQGGEVTPLFDIGSSLGSALGGFTGISPSFLAALGLIAVFGCAANAPLTTIMLGIDLFGTEAIPYYVIAAFVSYLVSGHQGIYTSQTIVHSKLFFLKHHEGYQLKDIKNIK